MTEADVQRLLTERKITRIERAFVHLSSGREFSPSKEDLRALCSHCGLWLGKGLAGVVQEFAQGRALCRRPREGEKGG